MDLLNKIKKLTDKEKATLVQGTGFMYTNEIKRLGIPFISMSDGPHGVRKQSNRDESEVERSEPATSFPTAAMVASSWNPALAKEMAGHIAKECSHYGVQILLGPGVNIKRNPLCGRNFEYYSEDPLLAGKIGTEFVKGLEEAGVCACVKHFAANNQENFRYMGSSYVDDRAMDEIYLKPFEYVIKDGKPGAVMTSYNRVNGTFASENKHLIDDILRKNWGYDGLVMSDWGGTHDRLAGLIAGEDLEMPGDTEVNKKKIYEALKSGKLKSELIDKSIERILSITKKYKRNLTAVPEGEVAAHTKEAIKVALDSAVLLKNENGILPLNPKKKICVIGGLFESMRYQGSGSSMMTPNEVIDNMRSFGHHNIDFTYSKGYLANTDDPDASLEDEALKAASESKTVVLFLGLTDIAESECGDRENMSLPKNQLSLVSKLTEAGVRPVVVLYGGSPVELPFEEKTSAILYMVLPGQGGGEAMTRLLFGLACPCGKLAETWPMKYEDVPYGEEFSKDINELYKESIYVGYRYYDSAGVEVRYPFGYGLSYTTFDYSSLEIVEREGKINISFVLTNTGLRPGGEVCQLYVKNNIETSAVFKAKAELRDFRKVYLQPGEKKKIEFKLNPDCLKYYDTAQKRRILENGKYGILVGASSRDIRLSGEFEISNGEKPGCPYEREIDEKYRKFESISDKEFESVLGYEVPEPAPALPLSLESRMSDFKKTFMGRRIYNIIDSYMSRKMKKAMKMPEGPTRDNHVKGVLFWKRSLESNCVRSSAMCMGKKLKWNYAKALIELSNGKIGRAIKELFTSHKMR